MSNVVDKVRSLLAHAQSSQATHANKRRRPVAINVGDYAWLATEHIPMRPGLSRKLGAKWIGPYRVVSAINPVAFKLDIPT